MRSFDYKLNPFGQYLAELGQRADKSMNQIAKGAGFRSTSRIFYAIRANDRRRRPSSLPVAVIMKLARVVKANPEEAAHLVLLGLKLQLVGPLREYVEFLETDNAKLRESLGKRPPKYSFTATD